MTCALQTRELCQGMSSTTSDIRASTRVLPIQSKISTACGTRSLISVSTSLSSLEKFLLANPALESMNHAGPDC